MNIKDKLIEAVTRSKKELGTYPPAVIAVEYCFSGVIEYVEGLESDNKRHLSKEVDHVEHHKKIVSKLVKTTTKNKRLQKEQGMLIKGLGDEQEKVKRLLARVAELERASRTATKNIDTCIEELKENGEVCALMMELKCLRVTLTCQK